MYERCRVKNGAQPEGSGASSFLEGSQLAGRGVIERSSWGRVIIGPCGRRGVDGHERPTDIVE